MTGIFDGLSGVLNATFGAPVRMTPQVGLPVSFRGIFRETPTLAVDGNGREVVTTALILRAPAPLADDLARADSVEPSVAPGRLFRVLSRVPGGSPAADAMVEFVLEEITP